MRAGLSQEDTSHAIGLARILLIIGLVFLHYGSFPGSAASPFNGLDTAEHSFATWVNSAVLFFFFSCVPLLSMVSGWLFFSFTAQDAGRALRQRIGKRFVSLYLPLVAWNTAYLTVFYVLYRHNPAASFFTQSNRISMNFATGSAWEFADAILGITRLPFAFQFWFVRDLFITTLVTPVFWLLLKRTPWLGAAILGTIWLSGWNLWIFIRTDVPFFFYMGALLRIKQLPLTLSARAVAGIMAGYVLLVALRALAPYAIPGAADGMNPFWLDVATRLMRMVGVLGCWGVMYRLARTSAGRRASAYGGLAFFLHSAHWPLLALVKSLVARVMLMDNDAALLAHYVISVALTVMLGLACGLLLARFAPRLFALMNGGRLLQQHTAAPMATAMAAPA